MDSMSQRAPGYRFHHQVPPTSDAASKHLGGEPELAQPVEHVEAGEPGADHDGVDRAFAGDAVHGGPPWSPGRHSQPRGPPHRKGRSTEWSGCATIAGPCTHDEGEPMTATDAPTINLLDPQFYVDPYPGYRWLRDNDPVHWDPVHRIWGVSRYADVVEVEKQTELYSSLWGSRPATDQRDDTSMINMDDPEHQKQRMLVARQFTPRAVKQLEDYLRGIVTELIDDVVAAGTCEAITALASPLPAIAIGHKLGYPRELWPKVREWSEVTMYESGQNPPDGTPQGQSDRMISVMMDFAAVTMDLIAQRRADPQGDLISLWATTEVDGRLWDDGEILSECLLLLDGGAETTRTVIGSIIRELALQPDQRQILLDRPEVLADTGGRGVHPLGHAHPQHAPHRHPRPHLPGQGAPRGRPGAAHVRRGQPRRAGLRRARPLRRDPGPQPPRGLRLRHPLLPRLLAGPHRDPGDVRGAAAAHPRLAPGARAPSPRSSAPPSPGPTTRCTSSSPRSAERWSTGTRPPPTRSTPPGSPTPWPNATPAWWSPAVEVIERHDLTNSHARLAIGYVDDEVAGQQRGPGHRLLQAGAHRRPPGRDPRHGHGSEGGPLLPHPAPTARPAGAARPTSPARTTSQGLFVLVLEDLVDARQPRSPTARGACLPTPWPTPSSSSLPCTPASSTRPCGRRRPPWVPVLGPGSDYGKVMLEYGIEHHRDRLTDAFVAVAGIYCQQRPGAARAVAGGCPAR